MICVLCARRNRTRELETGHVCPSCRNALRVDLGQILDLVAIAATMPDPFASRTSTGGGRPHPASRPPLEVARIDPELILVRLDPHDPSTAVPLLVMLEEWERLIRDERGYARYGLASSLRSASSAHGGPVGPRATLAGVVAFLRSQADYVCDEPSFSLEQMVDEIRRAIGVLRALDPSEERRDGWGIPCPADVDQEDGDEPEVCGRRLTIGRHDDGRLDLHGDIHCPDCGTVWTAQRLLLVALADDRVTVWGYPEVIQAALGIPRATLQRWAEKGSIRRFGNRYDTGAAFRLRHARAEA